MAYTQKFGHRAFFSADAAAPEIVIDIGGSSTDHGELSCSFPCTVTQLQFHVTDELGGGTSVAPIVTFTKRPTPNSATGEAIVGTLTIPDGQAVGSVVYKNLTTPVRFNVGDVMEISHTVGTGTPTGQGIATFICEHSPEVEANMTGLVASA